MGGQAAEHEMSHGYMDPGLGCFGNTLSAIFALYQGVK